MALTATQLLGDKTVAGSIKDWAQHATVPSTSILTEAQAFIYERLRAREMQQQTMVSLAIDDDSISLSNAFLEPIALLLDGDSDPLPYVHENLIRRTREDDGTLETGRPSCWTILSSSILFDVKCEEALTGWFWAYERPDELAITTNETNFLTSRFPTLLRRACLMFAWEFRNRNDMYAMELGLVEKAIMDANIAEEMVRKTQRLR